MSDQAVIITFVDFAARFFTEEARDLSPLFALEDQLEGRLTIEGHGELDGHEIAIDGSDGTIYLYGPDARAIYDSIKDILETSAVTRGGTAYLYFGDVTDEKTRVEEFAIGGLVS